MEKTKKIRIAIGVTAFAAVVTMNLIHAWNNYGITDSSRLLGINASPAEDEDATISCATKPGFKDIYHNRETETTTHHIDCPTKEVTPYYTKNHKGEIEKVATATFDYTSNSINIKFDCDTIHSLTGLMKGITEITEQEFTSNQIVCEKKAKKTCCYPKDAELDCKNLIKGTN
ncbi:MAG: hypothetical protein NC388_03220 [Clostridium sp.]|nr:hypothetical protein [Clostridium sp.]